jgi:Tfp pilus assembly protein PilZ
MRLLTVPFRSSEEFLSHVRDTVSGGHLFVRTRTELSEGETVVMEISFPGLPNRALVRGIAGPPRHAKGTWMRFHPSDASTRAFLIETAAGEAGETPTVYRSCPRFPAELPVECRIARPGVANEERLMTTTVDVGAGGVFLRASEPPPVGSGVALAIETSAGGRDRLEIDGHVAWTGGHAGGPGFGVRFENKTRLDAKALRTALRRASETGRIGFAEAAASAL